MRSGAYKEDARAVWCLGALGTPLHLQRVVRWKKPALDVQTGKMQHAHRCRNHTHCRYPATQTWRHFSHMSGDSDVRVKRLGRCLF